MFSQTSEYALRCMLHMARNPNAVQPIPEIAEAAEIPRQYLYKLLQLLRRPGLVSTSRGKHGGVRLARAPEAVTLYDILHAVQPFHRLHGCPLNNRMRCAKKRLGGDIEKLCDLHALIDGIAGQVERRLSSITLADFLDRDSRPVMTGAAIRGQAFAHTPSGPRKRLSQR